MKYLVRTDNFFELRIWVFREFWFALEGLVLDTCFHNIMTFYSLTNFVIFVCFLRISDFFIYFFLHTFFHAVQLFQFCQFGLDSHVL